MKELLAICAALIIVIAYIPYVKDVLKDKTKPHAYSWFVSALVTFIAFGLQLSEGAAWGVLPTFVGAMAGFLIFFLAVRRQKGAPITRSDTFFFVMSLVAVILWLVIDQPLLSVIIVSSIDILAFIPTFRKSWSRPDQETVSFYAINSLRFTLSTIAVQKYSFITVLYPLSQALADGLFALFLLARRHALAKN